MSSYSRRPEEMLRELAAMKPVLPEQTTKNIQAAIEKYKSWRAEALGKLLQVLEEDDDDEFAREWKDLCDEFREDASDFLEDNIKLESDVAAGTHFVLTMMARESKFFDELGKTNAAQVRDYLAKNRQSLAEYTRVLDDKWRAIVENGNRLQAEEKGIYQEMLASTRKIVGEFVAAERTAREKMAYAAQFPLLAAEKLAGMFADLIGGLDGTGELAEQIAKWLAEKNQAWLEGNSAIMGRIANYRALVNAEKGGVLPLFKETRREVYEYWEKNKVEVARDWIAKFRASVESEWVGRCPTSGQQDDARDFYKDALERIEKHFKAVESIAREFEDKWTGVFKGALSPNAMDELIDANSARVTAEELISIRTPEVITELLEKMDGYYEESLEKPLQRLADAVDDLPETARDEARRAVELAQSRVRQSVRDRIRIMQTEIGRSLNWFQPQEIQKALDRSELADELK
ncbi:MAG TPA: hypothetical protein VFU13_09775 [Steroidobacteraceae bacterium]|nr:hypothetical protein [Steroidobacteraceae bacterium]